MKEKESDMRDYKVLSKIYPVVINGYWFSIEEINNKPLRGCGGANRYIQHFFNQVVQSYIYQLQRFINTKGFYGILEDSSELFKAKDNVLYLTDRDDFHKRIDRAIEYSCLDTANNALIVELVMCPNRLCSFYKEAVVSKFKEDVCKWDEILSGYKQKRAYINRLNSLIKKMDEIDGLGIDSLQPLVEAQKSIYKERLKIGFIPME